MLLKIDHLPYIVSIVSSATVATVSLVRGALSETKMVVLTIYLPQMVRPYLRLMRLDHPIGIWLLLFPCLWSIALADSTRKLGTKMWLAALFALGAIIMRGAGCTYNDIVDRDFDSKVVRTAGRPLPTGALSSKRAIFFLLIQLSIGCLVLIQMNALTITLGVVSLFLVLTYPFMKRITFWPQAWLGLTFNWGALIGWTAVTGFLNVPAVFLYVGGIFWTLGYDTIYAHQDKEEDILIGVRSSAVILGNKTPLVILIFYSFTVLCTITAGLLSGLGKIFCTGIGLASLILIWQVVTLDVNNKVNCLKKFHANSWYGFLVLGAITADKTLQ